MSARWDDEVQAPPMDAEETAKTTAWTLPGEVSRSLFGGVDGPLGGEPAARVAGVLAGAAELGALRRMPGRETLLVEVLGRRFVLKRWDGEPGDGWRVWPAFLGSRDRSPAQREAEVLEELRASGFDVPAPLAWCRNGGRSALLLEFVEHDEDLQQALERVAPAERNRLLDELAELVARFHAAGFYHRDLYVTHIVRRRSDGSPVLLDLGRARRRRSPRTRWFVKDLAALLHSRPSVVGGAAAMRFLVRYLERRELARDERRAWARRVLAKARRIAAHEPKHADPDTYRPPGVSGDGT